MTTNLQFGFRTKNLQNNLKHNLLKKKMLMVFNWVKPLRVSVIFFSNVFEIVQYTP